MTNQRAIILLAQMYLPAFDDEEKMALTKAIEALTTQEPRVLTLDDLEEDEPYWLEQRRLFGEYVLLNHIEWDARIPYAFFVESYGHTSFETESYGKIWRCWSSRPTKKQMEVISWME